jgi:hypothetical protein
MQIPSSLKDLITWPVGYDSIQNALQLGLAGLVIAIVTILLLYYIAHKLYAGFVKLMDWLAELVWNLLKRVPMLLIKGIGLMIAIYAYDVCKYAMLGPGAEPQQVAQWVREKATPVMKEMIDMTMNYNYSTAVQSITNMFVVSNVTQ